MRRLVVALGSVWLVLTLAGCGGQDSPAPSASSGAPAEAVPTSLRFEGTGLDGSSIQGADFAGKDVALWFWAPW